jgi:hypothetical protein
VNDDTMFAWIVLGFAVVVLVLIAAVVNMWRRMPPINRDRDGRG